MWNHWFRSKIILRSYSIFAPPGDIVRSVVQELAPKITLELGTYFGYSAVLIASVMPKASRLLTVEFNEENAEIAQKFIRFARMDDKVGWK